MNFQDELKTAREKAGITQEECAALLDHSVSTIAKWEAGAFEPSKLTQKAVIEALNRTKVLK